MRLCHAGYSYRKRFAKHKSTKGAEERRLWVTNRHPRRHWEPDRLLVIDEPSVKTKLTRVGGGSAVLSEMKGHRPRP